MSIVRWLVVRCVMYLFRLPDYRMTIDQVAICRFGNRTKYITHRTTSHLTVDTSKAHLHEVDSLPAVENWACNRSANWAKSSFARRRIGAAPSVASLPVTSTRESMLRTVSAEEAFKSAQSVPERRFCPYESVPLNSALSREGSIA